MGKVAAAGEPHGVRLLRNNVSGRASMKIFTLRRALIVSLLLLCCRGAVLHGQAPDDAADAARLIEVLGLREGSVVADVGTGSGQLTVRIAPQVGGTGTVYSTDVNPERLRELREAIKKVEQQNVRVVEGASARTNLSERCCDAIFMRDVYHHFEDPPAMNASLRESLRPGARLAIVDFAPDAGVSVPPGRRDSGRNHGVTPETVMNELRAAGFIDVQQLPWSSPGYFLVVGRRSQ